MLAARRENWDVLGMELDHGRGRTACRRGAWGSPLPVRRRLGFATREGKTQASRCRGVAAADVDQQFGQPRCAEGFQVLGVQRAFRRHFGSKFGRR